MPVRRHPLSGPSRAGPACGQVGQAHLAPWQTTAGTTALVAERALERAETRQQRAGTRLQWSTRGPAPVRDAHAALAPADPPPMAPRVDGDRARVVTSTSGGGAPRWVLLGAEPRQPQAPQPVDQHRRPQQAQALHAFNTRGRMALAGAADAPQARATLAHG